MTYYFYDLETSGLNPKWQRIMQFAGQRTDADFNPIGEPHNWLVKLTPEVLPDPEAILVTGITPQKTLEEGYSEPEFAELLQREVFTKGTTVLGFNSIRFDDEFMRYTLYRNFFDPYEREWSDDRSRWDIMDLVRMTRALRPDGMQWPVTDDGKPTNRLELLTKENGIAHEAAHDALSDVTATIDMAKLIKQKQPKLFSHLETVRDKKKLKTMIEGVAGKPLVHTSGMMGTENLHTSAVAIIGSHPTNSNAVLAYDLRYSPLEFKDLSLDELKERVFTREKELKEKGKKRLPIKAIHLNKSPAVAPLGVLDEASQGRINLTLKQIEKHYSELVSMLPDFGNIAVQIFESESDRFTEETDADAMLYSSFISNADKTIAQQVRNKSADQLADWHPNLSDPRMIELLLRYKAKHYPSSLSEDEKQLWDQYKSKRLAGAFEPSGMQAYMNKLEKMAAEAKDENQKYLLEELQLYAQSIAPYENETLV